MSTLARGRAIWTCHTSQHTAERCPSASQPPARSHPIRVRISSASARSASENTSRTRSEWASVVHPARSSAATSFRFTCASATASNMPPFSPEGLTSRPVWGSHHAAWGRTDGPGCSDRRAGPGSGTSGRHPPRPRGRHFSSDSSDTTPMAFKQGAQRGLVADRPRHRHPRSWSTSASSDPSPATCAPVSSARRSVSRPTTAGSTCPPGSSATPPESAPATGGAASRPRSASA